MEYLYEVSETYIEILITAKLVMACTEQTRDLLASWGLLPETVQEKELIVLSPFPKFKAFAIVFSIALGDSRNKPA